MFDANAHMMKLKGKDYLQVAWRLVWFREDHPLWDIRSEMISYDPEAKHAIFKATISDENGIQKSSAHGSESAKDFGDYIEKAETKAVGRALAMLGYGTQFSPDLDEGERIVDSPIERVKQDKPAEPPKAMPREQVAAAKAAVYQTTPEQEAKRTELIAQIETECRARKKKYGGDLHKLTADELSATLAQLIGA